MKIKIITPLEKLSNGLGFGYYKPKSTNEFWDRYKYSMGYKGW